MLIYINDKNKLCKPLWSDDLQNCKESNYGKRNCDTFKDCYYLGESDKKCTKTDNCSTKMKKFILFRYKTKQMHFGKR